MQRATHRVRRMIAALLMTALPVFAGVAQNPSFGISPMPDLALSKLDGPRSTAPESEFVLSAKIENLGMSRAPRGWQATVTLLPWARVRPTLPRTIAVQKIDRAISSREAWVGRMPVRVPEGVAPGLYELRVELDTENAIQEGNERNNRRSLSHALRISGRELTPESLQGAESLNLGQSTEVRLTVRNPGLLEVQPGWKITFHVADSDVVGPDDPLIGETVVGTAIGVSSSIVIAGTVKVPVEAADKSRIIAVLDSSNAVREDDESNNQITVPSTLHSRANLQITGVTVPRYVAAGSEFPVVVTVRNGGLVGAPAGWSLKILRSEDAQIAEYGFPCGTATDFELHSSTFPVALDPGASHTVVVQARAPALFPSGAQPGFCMQDAEGDYYIGAGLYASGVVVESMSSDNTLAAGYRTNFSKGGDVVARSVTIPATAVAGVNTTIGFGIHNRGGSPIHDRIEARVELAGGMLPAVHVIETEVPGPLLGGATAETEVVLPVDPRATGDLSLKIILDPRDLIFEDNHQFPSGQFGEANNVHQGRITVRRTYDLGLVNVEGAFVVLAGTPVELTTEVINHGPSAADRWAVEHVFVDSNGNELVPKSSVQYMGAALLPQRSEWLRSGVLAPSTPGALTLKSRVVASGGSDPDPLNDMLARSMTVLGLADLSATALTIPTQVRAGQPLAITFSAANLSAWESPAGWTVRIYLALDPGLPPQDGPIGEWVGTAHLDGGAQTTVNFDITVPATMEKDNYHVIASIEPVAPDPDNSNNSVVSTSRIRVH